MAEEMEEVRQELYLEEEAERERHRQLAELEKKQRQRDELQREQEEMMIQRQRRLQAEREQEEVYRQQVGTTIMDAVKGDVLCNDFLVVKVNCLLSGLNIEEHQK